MRLPTHADDLLTRVTTARSCLERQLGRRPTTAQLAADLAIDEEKVAEILRHAAVPLSLSQPLGEDDAAALGDVVEDHAAISPFDAMAAALLSDEVDKVLVVLDAVNERSSGNASDWIGASPARLTRSASTST